MLFCDIHQTSREAQSHFKRNAGPEMPEGEPFSASSLGTLRRGESQRAKIDSSVIEDPFPAEPQINSTRCTLSIGLG
jgi:hypothetical protein